MTTHDDSPVPASSTATPVLATDQMREVDRLMSEAYGIELLQMMENAGRHLAHLARFRFLDGGPRGTEAVLIRAANDHSAPVLSLDMPSGLDATTGLVHAPAVPADATMTLALPKVGLGKKDALKTVGALFLADIGVPPSLCAAPEVDHDVGLLFARHDLLSLTPFSDDRFRTRPYQ